jgi:hypothetical protein
VPPIAHLAGCFQLDESRAFLAYHRRWPLTELRNDHNCHSKSGSELDSDGSELGSGGFEQRLKRELSLG